MGSNVSDANPTVKKFVTGSMNWTLNSWSDCRGYDRSIQGVYDPNFMKEQNWIHI